MLLLRALSMQANIRLASTFVFHDVNSNLICNISRDTKYPPKQPPTTMHSREVPRAIAVLP